MDLRAIAMLELDQGFPNNEVIGLIALDLAQRVDFNVDNERNFIPRNRNYFEETIPLYMGDLFVEHFRMSRQCFEELVMVLGNNGLQPRTIPIEKKILFTIWILAKPETFLAAGDRFGFPRSTAYEVFKEVIGILVGIREQYIIWPNNHDDAIAVFHERSRGFPGVVGAIDGCHIPIKQPIHNANDYYNRKQTHSIILQGICNHQRLFIDIHVGFPGRVHDARVFRSSPIYTQLINENNPLLPQDCHLIGDSAYPVMANLLTPFRDNGHLNEDQIRYNTKLSSIRSVIERAFGRLKGKFRRLKYLDIAQPEFGTEIIAAACVLHNFTLMQGDDIQLEDEYDNDNDDYDVQENNITLEDNRRIGIQKRVNIVNILRN